MCFRSPTSLGLNGDQENSAVVGRGWESNAETKDIYGKSLDHVSVGVKTKLVWEIRLLSPYRRQKGKMESEKA